MVTQAAFETEKAKIKAAEDKIKAYDEIILEIKGKYNDYDKRFEAMDKRIKFLEDENNKLKQDLSTGACGTGAVGRNGLQAVTYSSLFQSNKNNECINVIMAKVAMETNNKNRIENNIIISGVENSEPDDDENKIHEILDLLGIEKEAIEKPTRIKKRKIITPEPNSNSTAAQTVWVNSDLIRVRFKESATRTLALKNAKNLKDNEATKKYYINPEQTEAERNIEKQLRDERNKRNKALGNGEGRLTWGLDRNGKKYYWGIRWGRLVQIQCSNQ